MHRGAAAPARIPAARRSPPARSAAQRVGAPATGPSRPRRRRPRRTRPPPARRPLPRPDPAAVRTDDGHRHRRCAVDGAPSVSVSVVGPDGSRIRAGEPVEGQAYSEVARTESGAVVLLSVSYLSLI